MVGAANWGDEWRGWASTRKSGGEKCSREEKEINTSTRDFQRRDRTRRKQIDRTFAVLLNRERDFYHRIHLTRRKRRQTALSIQKG